MSKARLETNLEVGDLRLNEVADILSTIYKKDYGVSVYTIYNKCSIRKPHRKMLFGTYVYREGITVVVRPLRKAPDIKVFKEGNLWSCWEVTNYGKIMNGKNKGKLCYMKWDRLYRYIKNLTKFDCHRFLIVSHPDNFRLVHPDKTAEYNIEWTEKKLAKEKIFLIYWEFQHKLPEQEEKEVIGWVD